MVRDRRLVIFWDLDKAGESQTGRVGNRETENEGGNEMISSRYLRYR